MPSSSRVGSCARSGRSPTPRSHPALRLWAATKGARHQRWYTANTRPLSLRLDDDAARPWFFWDEDLSVAEVKARLAGEDRVERLRLLGKLLREANDTEVWQFVTPQEVADALPELARALGTRRLPFWTFVIDRWRAYGLVR
jgi:hypothetical protein